MGSRIAAVALAALTLATVMAAPANAARGMEIGLQDDAHFLDEDALVRGAALAHARSLRASSLRANVPWASVVSNPAAVTAPAAVSFDFSRFDRLIDEAAAHGIRVQLTLTGDAPAWATRDRRISDDHPDPKRFAEFAAAAASHFNGRVR
ncbi:beta-galactosidase, partial [Microbacterium sp.]|uniref:beta-galactosidase n=1 Tax=Microbacterium sp. TaxID=51671 RepID=UPI002E376890